MLTSIAALAHADPKREVPDYDGRGNPDSDGGSWPLWIPRIALSPLYAINEYVLRRPIGFLVRKAEREHWADTVESLFTFGEGDKNLIVPTALFDFGLLPSVGIYYAGRDTFADGNELHVHAATWGRPWIDVTVADRYKIDGASRVEARAEFKRSEDNIFFGIGPNVSSSTQSRYGLERVEGGLSYRRTLWNESRLDVGGGVHRLSFVDGTCCANPSVSDRVAAGELVAPPGFGDAYTTAYGRVDLALDTRLPDPSLAAVPTCGCTVPRASISTTPGRGSSTAVRSAPPSISPVTSACSRCKSRSISSTRSRETVRPSRSPNMRSSVAI